MHNLQTSWLMQRNHFLCSYWECNLCAFDQLVLDMSRSDVIDYLYESISAVLRSAKISYIKWDFNRSLSNVFSGGLPADRQGEVAHRFVLGSYRLMERLRESFPDVMIEGCSGGGGRFDPVFGSYPAIQIHFRKKC